MPVRFHVRGESLSVPGADRTVADLAHDAGLPLQTACGGHGVCGRCAVILRGGNFHIEGRPAAVVPAAPRRALACQTRVADGEADIEIPATTLVEQKGQIDGDFVLPAFTLAPRQCVVELEIPAATLEHAADDVARVATALAAATGNAQVPGLSLLAARNLPGVCTAAGGRIRVAVGPFRGRTDLTIVRAASAGLPNLGVAADIGTTTVVAVLLDLDRGAELARASDYNAQLRKADDVAARISYARDGAGLEELRRLIVEQTLNPLIRKLVAAARARPDDLGRIAVSGNTVMMHLLLGLPPAGIGVLPFQPVLRNYPDFRACEVGLDAHPNAVLDLVPSMSGNVGGDLTSDAYAARLLERRGLTLLVDIGTNGEILLWDGSRLRATATAAGPAFEGAGIEHGCRAAEGAVDHIEWDAELRVRYTTIGGGRAMGFCGSAIIDFVAQSFRAGVLNENGRYDLELLRRGGRYLSVGRPGGAVHACLVVPADESASGKPLYLTERDVAETMKAKGAIYAGMKTLLAAAGKTWADLDALLLAGGFARHIHLRHAAWMGLLPDLPPGRIEVVGNGSLAGACLALLDAGAFPAFEHIAGRAESVELNLQRDFETNYIDALLLPNADTSEFAAALAELGRPAASEA